MKKKVVLGVVILAVVVFAGRAIIQVAGLGAKEPEPAPAETLTLAPEVEEGLKRLEEQGKLEETGARDESGGETQGSDSGLPVPPTDLVTENGELRIQYLNPAQVCRPGDEMLDLYRNIRYVVAEIQDGEQSVDPSDAYLEPELLSEGVFSADGALNSSFKKDLVWKETEWITVEGREIPAMKETAREEREGTRKLVTVSVRAENLQDAEQTVDMYAFSTHKTSWEEGYLAYLVSDNSAPYISIGDFSEKYLYDGMCLTCRELTGNIQQIDGNVFVFPGRSEAEFVLTFLVDCEEEDDLYLQFNPLGKGQYEYDSSQFFFLKLK